MLMRDLFAVADLLVLSGSQAALMSQNRYYSNATRYYSNDLAISAASAERCSLLSAILDIHLFREYVVVIILIKRRATHGISSDAECMTVPPTTYNSSERVVISVYTQQCRRVYGDNRGRRPPQLFLIALASTKVTLE